MDNQLLNEDVEITSEGFGLTRIYLAPRRRIVRVEVWQSSRKGDERPAMAAASVLDHHRLGWTTLLELSHASWRTKGVAVTSPGLAQILEAHGPVADDLYTRTRTVLDHVDDPSPTTTRGAEIVVTTADGGPLAVYSDPRQALEDVDAINRETGQSLLMLSGAVIHNPPREILRMAAVRHVTEK